MIKDITESELHWVAGLLEGEGCFVLSWKKSKTGRYPTFKIQCKMTDRDVIAKLTDTLGIGLFSTKQIPKCKNRKPFWGWSLHKRDEVETLLGLLLPLMGDRRQAKIRLLLKTLDQHPGLKSHHGTRNKYERHKCRCQPCKDAHSARFRKLRRVANPNIRKTGEQYLNYEI